MKTRSFSILAIAFVAAAVAAFFASRGSDSSAASSTAGQKFLPDLVVNDVAQLTLAGPEALEDPINPEDPSEASAPDAPATVTTFVVKKEGESWGAADKGGYPIDVGKLKQLVIGLAEMRVVAEMTKKPEGHVKLGVQEITEPKAESKRVTLRDSSGKVVADVLIGKPKQTRNFGGKPSLYVRRVGENQVYEVTGQLSVAVDAASWLDREVAKLEAGRVRQVTTTHGDGTQLIVNKSAPEDANFAVEGLPADKELMWPGVANGIASALQYLNLEDVQKSEGVDLSGATITEYVTFDGMVVTVKTLEKDGKTWLGLSAAFDESKIVDVPTVVAPPVEGEEAPVTPPPAKPVRKTPEEVKTEVAALNQKAGPWLYAVPGYSAANFRKKLDDLLKKDEPAVPMEGTEEGGVLELGNPPVAPPGHSADDGHDHSVPPANDADSQPIEPPPTPPTPPPGG